ncbi:Chloramphenicol acetyltransferase-like domain-containing protein [Cynara cardunculus var. scolymus]|uniref:Chloramphenicol acetyltransferase-like domain-containing protein n=1 Tax=Cynara cardunculus var. scolymus TaxID=59895 RepID=A0A103YMD8_CYNCS|nr:Chloramphenicol acetyltransferase-like domain-containing protein [Cynara cardunculus var. scolymus]
MAECDDGSKSCRMDVVVDGRQRLDNDGSKFSSMKTYLGNVLSIPYGQANSDQHKEMPLSQAAKMLHDFVGGATTEEHFRGLVGWVELHRPKPTVAKIYTTMEEEDGEARVVSYLLDIDFSNLYYGNRKQ